MSAAPFEPTKDQIRQAMIDKSLIVMAPDGTIIYGEGILEAIRDSGITRNCLVVRNCESLDDFLLSLEKE